MRSYNIAVLASVPSFMDYHMPDNPVRAMNRLGKHNIIEIDHDDIYRLHGPSATKRIINKILHEKQIDIVMCALGCNYEFPIEYFSELRKHYFTVLHSGEDEHFFDKSSRYYSQVFDLVITVGALSVMRYKLYGVEAIPYDGGYDVRLLEVVSREKKHDVCWVGSIANRIGRKEYLDYLAKNEIDVKAFGYGTSGGVISTQEMYKIFGSSRIGLSFCGVTLNSPLDMDLTINRRTKQMKGNTWQVPMAGSFLLAEYVSGIEDLYDVGSEIDIFHDRDELLSKVKYYLKNEAKREEMASRAYNRAIREHDELNVWGGFLEVISEKLEMKNKKNIMAENIIYKDPIFKRAFSSFHFFRMLEFVLRAKPRIALQEFLIYLKFPWIDRGVFFFYVKRLLVNVNWLRILVRKLKNLAEK